jgi:hypothetical protein
MAVAGHDGIAKKDGTKKNQIVLKRKNRYVTMAVSKKPITRL